MKKIFLSALLLTAVALAAFAYGAPARQLKSHQFRCTDRNTSLYFLVYEQGGKLNGGHMYVENMQVGVLTAEWAGTGVINATLAGNTAKNISFHLHRAVNKVLVVNSATPERVEVCKVNYKYQ
ncbi:MAG: hypothetical protein M3416_07165 [Acidobacteriota bacterium]|nr:hypothetical protein [Acidobacteriota bacterium]